MPHMSKEALRSRARADAARLAAYSRGNRVDRLSVEMPEAREWATRNGVLYEFQKAFVDAEGKWEHWEQFSRHKTDAEDADAHPRQSESQATRAMAWARPGGARAGSVPTPPAGNGRSDADALRPPSRRDEARIQAHRVSDAPLVVVLEVSGASALTAPHVSRLMRTLSANEAGRPQGVVLDLSAMQYLDASAVGLILDRAEKMQSRGAELVIVQPKPTGFERLQAMGIPAKVRCFPTREAAVEALVPRLRET